MATPRAGRGRDARPRGWVGLALLLATVAVIGAACGGSSDDDVASTSTAAPGTPSSDTTMVAEAPEVEVVTETFVDASRPTAAGAETPAKPDRTIVTRVAHPTSGGPYPLIVMSHGATGHPDEYAETIPMWAADGFVVAAPTFPLTNRDVPGAMGNIGDVVKQPGDVSFVIDEVLAATDDPASPLHGLVDADAVGVVGHSLGGATTWNVAFDTTQRDPRIDSAVIFASFTLPGGELDLGSGLPLLVMHGDADDVPIDADLAAYELAVAPKWFVTLLGAEHRLAFVDEPSPYDDLVTRTVLAFWHGTLDGDAEALERVTTEATDPELSRVQHE
jgi:dienelactone hydrolase